MTEKEEKIFSLQCESTKALLLAQMARPESEDAIYKAKIRMTPIDYRAQCVKEDGSIDLNVRHITGEEEKLHTDARYKRGSIIESLRPSETSNPLSEEKKERATSAFMRSFSVDALKARFKSFMTGMFKPSYAEVMADAIKKAKDGK